MTRSLDSVARPALRQLSGEDLYKAVTVDLAREAVRDAYIGFTAGRFIEPARAVADGGRFLAMACIDRVTQEVVTKAMTIRPENLGSGFSSHQSVVVVFGPSGRPLGIIDGNAVTTRRTGAASGVATDLLAVTESAVLAILGAGEQAAEQLRAVVAVRPITEVRIFSLDTAGSQSLADLALSEFPHLSVRTSTSADEAVQDADVVCCVTSATSPLFELEALSPTAHVNAIGSFRPDMVEVPPTLCISATSMVVDSIEAVTRTSGDIIGALALDPSLATRLVEIGSMLIEEPVRREGRTCFKSVGIGAQDLSVARLAFA